MQKNASLISKLGIGSLDIDMLTNDILDEDNKKTDSINESENIKNDNNNMNSNKKKQIDSRKQNDSRQQNDNIQKNNDTISQNDSNNKGARDSFLIKSRAKNKGFKGAEAPLAEAPLDETLDNLLGT